MGQPCYPPSSGAGTPLAGTQLRSGTFKSNPDPDLRPGTDKRDALGEKQDALAPAPVCPTAQGAESHKHKAPFKHLGEDIVGFTYGCRNSLQGQEPETLQPAPHSLCKSTEKGLINLLPGIAVCVPSRIPPYSPLISSPCSGSSAVLTGLCLQL